MAGNGLLAHAAPMTSRMAASNTSKLEASKTESLLDAINAADSATAAQLITPFIENAPWLALHVSAARPFSNPSALLAAIAEAIRSADEADQLRLLNGHPELAGVEAKAGLMTEASTGEQGRLGLDRLSAGDLARLETANRDYRSRFGFPYIVALHRYAALADIFRDLDARMGHDLLTERSRALEEVIAVTQGRLTRHFGLFPILPTD
ncbi:MAG: 2-oxo-4-hydroxy-4-carboxy-5-ureidoimidazoline decarboxylase [Alphaproteobacteria bacterium]